MNRMTRFRPSPALVVALVALFVALGGVGYAATAGRINGSQLKNRSVAGTKLKKNTVTGVEVNESTLGTVPTAKTAATAAYATSANTAASATRANSAAQADNATSLGGLGAASFLRSNRLLTGSASGNAAAGTEIFSDPDVGVDVQVGGTGSPRLVNTNASASIAVSGLDSLLDGATSHDNFLGRIARTVAPGANTEFRLSTLGPSYVDVLVTRLDASTPSLHLTCAFVTVGPPVNDPRISCVAAG